MARLPRLYAPRVPQLVQARFARPLALPGDATPAVPLDRICRWLGDEALRQAAALHAWVILPDSITLLATPADARALSLLMQALGRRMGSGLLRARVYAGRYHNALLQPGRWVLPAMQWLETRPVAGHYVDAATQWPWSSAAVHAGLDAGTHPDSDSGTGSDLAPGPGPGPELVDPVDYWQLGDTPFARQAVWRRKLATDVDPAQGEQIRAALHGQWALGEKIFLAHLARLASRRVSPSPRGRPSKDTAAQGSSGKRAGRAAEDCAADGTSATSPPHATNPPRALETCDSKGPAPRPHEGR